MRGNRELRKPLRQSGSCSVWKWYRMVKESKLMNSDCPIFPHFRRKNLNTKLYQHRRQIAKNNFCVINVENSDVCKMFFLDAIAV